MKEQPNYTNITTVSNDQRVEFYKKTYLHVALGVFAFVIIEYLFLHSAAVVKFAMSLTHGRMWLLMLGGFMLATNYAEKMAVNSTSKNKQYLGYLIYIVAEAFIFVPILFIAVNYMEGTGVLKQATILTLTRKIHH